MCEHETFGANVDVSRIPVNGPMRFVADVTVWCMDCGQKFGFVGLPKVISMRIPGTSATRLQASLPIEPIDVRRELAKGGTVVVEVPDKEATKCGTEAQEG